MKNYTRNLELDAIAINRSGHLIVTNHFRFDKSESYLKGESSRAFGSLTTQPSLYLRKTNKHKKFYLDLFLAPEVIQGKSFTISSQWWCFGCLLYQILTGNV